LFTSILLFRVLLSRVFVCSLFIMHVLIDDRRL